MHEPIKRDYTKAMHEEEQNIGNAERAKLSIIYSIYITIIIYIVFCLLISKYFAYLDKVDVNYIASHFIVPASAFLPQNVVKIQYIFGLFFIPVMIYIFGKTFYKTINYFTPSTYKKLNSYSSYVSLLIIASLCYVAIHNLLVIRFFYFTLQHAGLNITYLDISSNIDYIAIAGLCITGIITLIFWFIAEKQYKIRIIDDYKKIFSKIATWLSVLITTLISAMFIFDTAGVNETYTFTDHFNSVFYPISQVHQGKALLVDFVNMYGLYPQLLDPLFRVIGLDTLKFTIVMAFLLLLSFICWYIFLRLNIENKLILFFGYIGLLFIGYVAIKYNFDPYFQFYPIRVIFPAIFLLASYMFIKNRNTALYYGISVLAGIAALWNLETGIILLITWLMLLCFDELFKPLKVAIKRIIGHVITSFAIIAMIVAAYSSYIFLRYHSWLDYTQMFQYMGYYYSMGYLALPLKPIDLWNIVILIYILAISYSILCLIMRWDTSRSRVFFTLSIFGAGLYSYYQGRNFPIYLTYVWYPALMLLILFADSLYQKIKVDASTGMPSVHRLIALSMILLLFFTSTAFMILDSGFILGNTVTICDSVLNKKPTYVDDNVEFIKRYTSPGEAVIIFSGNQGVYYAESNTVSPLNVPGLSEMLLKSDQDKIVNHLITHKGNKVFVDGNYTLNESYQTALINYIRVDQINNDSMILYKN